MKTNKWGQQGSLGIICAVVMLSGSLRAEEADAPTLLSQDAVQMLLKKIAAQDARIEELERQLVAIQAGSPSKDNLAIAPAVATKPVSTGQPVAATPISSSQPTETPAPASAVASQPAPSASIANSPIGPTEGPMDGGVHDHMMTIPNGPTLHIRGFFDFNFDTGSVAQNLQYPLGVPAASSFRTGEFDLFMSSQITPKLSFLSELVTSSGPNNQFEVDLERYVLTYRQNKYFSVGAGRYHTSIGYYNTAYHHGTWFQTATGRPLMYYFEDSGGPLPVHEVGVTSTGEIPSGALGLHWVFEVGNGQAPPGANFGDGVENFASNRNHKDVNIAFYSRPDWIPGLQVGGSHLMGDLISPNFAKVSQDISSVYAVYFQGRWEFLNEAVLMHHQLGAEQWNSPMGYTQFAYRLGNRYRPYFRFQEVNVPDSDPVSPFVGRYEGPSVGLRTDIFDYAAFKLQYNRVYSRNAAPQNGMEANVSFTF
jgi:hypothetical protein